MAVQTITCPDCGRVGKVAGQWVKPGVASGDFMEGLEPLTCDSCRKALNEQGYAVVVIRPRGDGTADMSPA